MYWGRGVCDFAVLPEMRRRGNGTTVNVTSIGGNVSVPHLLPYTSAKFAATGSSERLRAEVARDGVGVLTVVPGLMHGVAREHVFQGTAPRRVRLVQLRG